MKKADMGKPKADWKPPQGYNSALGKARDEAKAKAKKVNSMTNFENENDTASEDDNTYSQVGQSFSMQALTPFQPVRSGTSWSSAQTSPSATRGTIAAVNAFKDLDDEHEYDSSICLALSTWASKVHVKPVTKQRTIRLPDRSTGDNINKIADWVENKKKPADAEVVVQSSKDISHTGIAALPQGRKGKARLEKKIKRIELGPSEILCMVDSGSFVHAINARVELPNHQLIPPTGQDKQIIA